MTELYPDDITLIRYHMPYPGNDPFYAFNSEENFARMTYYGITGTSHLYIDGIVDAGYYSSAWDSLFNMRMDVPSPMDIAIGGTYNISNRGVSLSIRVIANDRIDWSDLRLHCVTVEDHIHWLAPNGLRIHNQVMRDMVPDAHGEEFRVDIGDTMSFTRDFILNSSLNPDSCCFVVFVQADSSRTVLQAQKISLPELHRVRVGDDSDILPSITGIKSCQPNPFNSSTTITYNLLSDAEAVISVYNIVGRKVAELNCGRQAAGEHRLIWDASALPSGTYFARLESGLKSRCLKMLLLK